MAIPTDGEITPEYENEVRSYYVLPVGERGAAGAVGQVVLGDVDSQPLLESGTPFYKGSALRVSAVWSVSSHRNLQRFAMSRSVLIVAARSVFDPFGALLRGRHFGDGSNTPRNAL